MIDPRLTDLGGQALREVLAGVADGHDLPESEAFVRLQAVLERLIPAVLGWRHESLDGFRFAVAKRVGLAEAECLGLCLLISDQTWTAIHLRLCTTADGGALQIAQCHLGETDVSGQMVRLPYDSSRVTKELMALPARLQSVSWAYEGVSPRALEPR
jgi:hypothetical protein